MEWKLVSQGLPTGIVLILADGVCHVAVLVDDDQKPAFMNPYTSDLLPWPSHWMDLPPPPPR